MQPHAAHPGAKQSATHEELPSNLGIYEMTIPNVQAGETRFRQPFFSLSRPGRAFEGGSMRCLLRIALALGVFLSVSTAPSASPARLLTVRFSGDCEGFTIVVTGEGLSQPNPTVSYNITLTPRSGEPVTIVNSSGVTPEKDGKFRKTIHGTWKKFEIMLPDAFTLSGSAILISDLTLLHTTPITFSRTSLNCRLRPAQLARGDLLGRA